MIEFSVRRPVAILMLCIGLLALGTISAQRIPIQFLPEIKSTQFSLITDMRGGTPEEIEEQITIPIERAISTVPGLINSKSQSTREKSNIQIELSTKADLVESVSILKDRIDSVSLPGNATKTRIVRSQANKDPIFTIAIKPKNMKLAQLKDLIQDTLIRQVEG